MSFLRARCSRWTRTCPKDDATWSSLSSDDRSENDGTVADAAAAAAENVAAVGAERRDTGGHCRSICCAADNTRSAPLHYSET